VLNVNPFGAALGEKKKRKKIKSSTRISLVVFHHTDTYSYLLSLALALIHNKLNQSLAPALSIHNKQHRPASLHDFSRLPFLHARREASALANKLPRNGLISFPSRRFLN
jgi:hypothetical protein